MGAGREEQVMLRAYEIWEREGRPEGRQEEHWRRAEQEVGKLGWAFQEAEAAEASADLAVARREMPRP
jgi:hypothetical protein